MFAKASNPKRRSANIPNSGELIKKYPVFRHFLSMNRLRNQKNLTWWAMVETISKIARGLQKVATNPSVMLQYPMTYDTVFIYFNNIIG